MEQAYPLCNSAFSKVAHPHLGGILIVPQFPYHYRYHIVTSRVRVMKYCYLPTANIYLFIYIYKLYQLPFQRAFILLYYYYSASELSFDASSNNIDGQRMMQQLLVEGIWLVARLLSPWGLKKDTFEIAVYMPHIIKDTGWKSWIWLATT